MEDVLIYDETGKEVTGVKDDSVTTIVIPDSVTSIGDKAFHWCRTLTSIVIPDSVTSIGDSAFLGCSSISRIDIPNSVTSIGSGAFHWCSSLTCIDIPNSVTSIGTSAFWDCSSLTSVDIPNSVTSIGEDAFWGCSSLASITVSSDNPSFIDIDGVLYNKDKTKLICVPQGKDVKQYTIPDSVTCIENSAFSYCSSLTSIVIPDSVTSIGVLAFCYCNSLTSVDIPNSVTSIGEGAFWRCSSLASIKVSSDNPSFMDIDGVLYNKDKTRLICVPQGKDVKQYTIPDSVTSIGEFAFGYCDALTSIVIPDSVTSIGNNAFNGCCSLTSIDIPDSVTSIGEFAFYDCSSLTEIHCRLKSPNSIEFKIGRVGFIAFSKNLFDACTLYVPVGTESAYRQHSVFGKFKNIEMEH